MGGGDGNRRGSPQFYDLQGCDLSQCFSFRPGREEGAFLGASISPLVQALRWLQQPAQEYRKTKQCILAPAREKKREEFSFLGHCFSPPLGISHSSGQGEKGEKRRRRWRRRRKRWWWDRLRGGGGGIFTFPLDQEEEEREEKVSPLSRYFSGT